MKVNLKLIWIITAVCVIICGILSFASCEKNKDNIPDTDRTSTDSQSNNDDSMSGNISDTYDISGTSSISGEISTQASGSPSETGNDETESDSDGNDTVTGNNSGSTDEGRTDDTASTGDEPTGETEETQSQTDGTTETETTKPVITLGTLPETDVGNAADYKGIVISKVYGNGGNIDAAVKYSFIELCNTSSKAIDLDGLALYYKSDNSKNYAEYDFEETYLLGAGKHLLIRCAEANEAGKAYDSSYARLYVDKFDLEWDLVIDNREIRLLLAPAGLNPSKNADPASIKNVVSLFVATDTYSDDVRYVDDMSKNKVAVRTALTDYSGFYLVNLTKAASSKLVQISPMTKDGSVNTTVRSALAEVVFSAPAGFYNNTVSLSLTADKGYAIYYTTDGSDPTTSSTRKKYSSPLSLTDSSAMSWGSTINGSLSALGSSYAPGSKTMIGGYVIKAYAENGTQKTGVFTNTYFVTSKMSEYKVSVMSLSMNTSEIYGPNGFYNHYTSAENDPNTRGTGIMEVFDENGVRYGYSSVELAVSGHGSSGWRMKSMRVYYKGANNTADGLESELHYDLFGGYAVNDNSQVITDFARLLLRNSGNDCADSYIRDAYMQRVCATLNVDTLSYTPVLLFINGEFWGVYNARERYSGDYIEEHYGVDKDNVALLESDYEQLVVYHNSNAPFIVSSGIEGDEKDFNDVVSFIRSHDLSIKENYDYVASKLDLDSFIDMYVARLFFNARDWPENNIKIWRNRNPEDPSGMNLKWHFSLLDMDMGISFFTDGNNTTENANFFGWCDATGCVVGTIMSALRRNVNFKNQFLLRFYEVVNEVLTPEYMADELNKLVAERAPIFDLQVMRWKNDGASWSKYNSSVANMQKFIQNRKSYVLQYLYNYFGVNEQYILSLSDNIVTLSYNTNRVNVKVNGVAASDGTRYKYDTDTLKLSVTATAKEGYVITAITFNGNDGTVNRVESTSAVFTIKGSGTVNIVTKRITTGGDTLKVQSGITAGSHTMYYLDPDGKLYAWGYNPNGILGINGAGEIVNKPVLIMENVAKVETNHSNDTENGNFGTVMTAVLTLDGEVYTIGANNCGQLGRNGTNNSASFGLISLDVKAVDISVGHEHLLVLDDDGTLWGVGSNHYGELGSLNVGTSTSQFRIIAKDICLISAGRRNTAYVDINGDCYILGDGRWNKFNDSTDMITTPYKLLSDVEYISSGEHEMLLVTGEGKLYYAGWRSLQGFYNGNGTHGAAYMCSGVEKASILFGNMVILKTDGTVYGYGVNTGNALGSESTSGTPTKINLNGVADVAAGYDFVAYLMKDGSIRVRGDNSYGEAGNGSTSSYVEFSAITIK